MTIDRRTILQAGASALGLGLMPQGLSRRPRLSASAR